VFTVVAVRPSSAAWTAVVPAGWRSTELPVSTCRFATEVGVPCEITSAAKVSGCSISSRDDERIVRSGPAR